MAIETNLVLTKKGQEKLDAVLERFTQFRTQAEDTYMNKERTYKVMLFEQLATVWDRLNDDPEGSRRELIGLIRGKEGADRSVEEAMNNLLGGSRGFVQRQDLAVFLEHLSDEGYQQLYGQLLEGDEEPAKRLAQFRQAVNSEYSNLFDAGRFDSRKTQRPRISQTFAAIFLASYDPESYILYRHGQYSRMSQLLELQVPSGPEACYAHFLEMSHLVLDIATRKQHKVDDLIDVHNMVYMLDRYSEFEDLREAATDGVAADVELDEEEEAEVGISEDIYSFIQQRGFTFHPWLVTDYLLSMATKPFVIFSGISGTGKTKLVQLVAEYVHEATGRSSTNKFISARPDWTDNSQLLGWYNAITETYERVPVLDLLLKAAERPDVPHFIILDEMNLAKVEHYFSDVLSCMESRWIDLDGTMHQKPILLHSRQSGDAPDIPAELSFPVNVYITGTVNVDETTYMFSPKVLDRVNVIEFNEVYLDSDVVPDLEDAEGFTLRPEVSVQEVLAAYKPATTTTRMQMKEHMPEQFGWLLRIHRALQPHHLHFGYRVANEIAAFLINAERFCVGGSDVLPFAFDLQVLQKILPKLHGTAGQLRQALEDLHENLPHSCVQSRRKIERMQRRLDQVGFASYIE